MNEDPRENLKSKLKAIEDILDLNPNSTVEVNEVASAELGFYELRFQSNSKYQFRETFYKKEREGIGFNYARLHISRRDQNED